MKKLYTMILTGGLLTSSLIQSTDNNYLTKIVSHSSRVLTWIDAQVLKNIVEAQSNRGRLNDRSKQLPEIAYRVLTLSIFNSEQIALEKKSKNTKNSGSLYLLEQITQSTDIQNLPPHLIVNPNRQHIVTDVIASRE